MNGWRVLALAALVGCARSAVEPPPAPPPAPVPVAAPDPRDKNIEMTSRLLRATDDDDPQKPDFHLRLAELCAARWYDPGPREREPRRWFTRAEEAYRSTIRFADYARRDEALFKLGQLLESAGQEAAAQEAYDALIKEHPRSPLVPEAWGHRR